MSGKLALETVTFIWTTESETGFTLNLFAADNDSKALFSKMSKTNSLELDMGAIEGMETGKKYFWRVEKEVGESKVQSKKINFSVVAAAVVERAIMELEKTSSYKEASPWQKALRSAYTLEKNGFNNAAGKKYRQAMQAFPNNEIVKKAHSRFLDHVMR